jgi:hypothetical protein
VKVVRVNDVEKEKLFQLPGVKDGRLDVRLLRHKALMGNSREKVRRQRHFP